MSPPEDRLRIVSGPCGRHAFDHLLAIFAIALFHVGCSGGGLAGEYRDQRGVTGYEFKPNGRVFISVMGTTTAATYELEGNRVLINGADGIVALHRSGEELHGPHGLKLIRQQAP